MESTLERTFLRFGGEYWRDHRLFMREQERWILHEFQKRAHHYVQSPPPSDELLEWLALIQHYGGPTRLLDFTHSFYVAAFFAMESAATDACVWAVDEFSLREPIAYASSISLETDLHSDASVNKKCVAAAKRILQGGARGPGVLLVEPERVHERLAVQQGLFLFPCDLEVPFMENLSAAFDPERWTHEEWDVKEPDEIDFEELNRRHVVKVVIPVKALPMGLDDLRSMNITAATLFPGLDGFARSLGFLARPLRWD